jgi:hypothetical protein
LPSPFSGPFSGIPDDCFLNSSARAKNIKINYSLAL